MELTLSQKDLEDYLKNQLLSFYPDTKKSTDLKPYLTKALDRVEYCFSKIKNKYYRKNNEPFFNHLHSDQYAKFLFFISREAFLNSDESIYIKCSYLNKALNGIDLYGHVKMPNIFLLSHPIGTILGRANYKDYLIIGEASFNGPYEDPSFSEKTACFANSSIIGDVTTEQNSIFGANCSVIGGDYKSNSLIIGHHPNNKVKNNKSDLFGDYYYL